MSTEERAMADSSRPGDGALAAAISNAVVRELSRTTGRGPTKAKTTLGGNAVFVVLQDTLTRGEQRSPTLASKRPCLTCGSAGRGS